MKVCTLGDLLVDVIVRIDSPIALDTDTFSEIEITAGGQAANVAAWVSELGHDARLISTRFDDAPGSLLETELRRRRVEAVGPAQNGRTGTVVSLAQRDGTRTMLTDRGDSPVFAPSSFVASWLDEVDWLHISGYALATEPLRTTSLRAAALAHEASVRVSVDVASTRVIEAMGHSTFLALLEKIQPQLVFANQAEHRAAAPPPAPWPGETTWIIKRGAEGGTLTAADEETSFTAHPTTVVDPTGAGDAFAAGFLVDDLETARRAAARCVAQNGAMPRLLP